MAFGAATLSAAPEVSTIFNISHIEVISVVISAFSYTATEAEDLSSLSDESGIVSSGPAGKAWQAAAEPDSGSEFSETEGRGMLFARLAKKRKSVFFSTKACKASIMASVDHGDNGRLLQTLPLCPY